MYAKLINNNLEFPPKNKGSILNYDLNEEMLIADGYKPYVPCERPETIRMYHFEYVETDVITETIVYDETQEQAEARIAEEEAQRKAQLKMTKRDFFLYVVQPYGVTYSALLQALSQNDTVKACYDGCNHIYRGDSMLVGNIKPMLETLTGQTIDEQELTNFLDVQFDTHNATD